MHDWRYATPGVSHGPPSNMQPMPRRWRSPRWLIACAAVLLASCQRAGILDPQGPIGSAQLLLLINATEIMLVVVAPVILATLGVAWWYRSSNPRAGRSEELAYEGRIDFVIWSIPALVVILLAGSPGSAPISSIRERRSPRTPSRSRSTSPRSIGNGCLSTPIRVSLPSISWLSRREHRSTFV